MAFITEEPIFLERLVNGKLASSSGARAVFAGYVRDTNEGKQVSKLFYECYVSMAERQIESIVDEANKKWPLNRVFVLHRVGWLSVGEIAIVVVVDSAHRKEAFAACEWIVDAVKRDVPIWKKEVYVDKTNDWVECNMPHKVHVCR